MQHRSLLSAAALLSLAACASSPAALLNEATGSTSQTLCSKLFISGLAPAQVFDQHLRPEPGMGAIAWALRYDIDRQARTVRTRAFGGFDREAVFAEGRGCTLTYPDAPVPEALAPMAHADALLPEIAGPDLVTPPDPALIAALDAAFAEPETGAPRLTQAVVVVHRGRVVAERYAEGFGPDTPFLSHSMTKSIVNALVGILVRDGRLDVDASAPIEAWRAPNDPRAAISIDNLLRMNAGFGFDEGGGASIATHIWYNEPDTAAAAAEAEMHSQPGEAWGYCSRCYALLGRILGDTIGDGPQGVRDFAQRELFDPLGMHGVTLEFDAQGTMMGGQASFATPRDWARFGLLYLHDGVVGDRRILAEGWVAYSTRPSGDSGYGAGFWLNTTNAEIPEWRMRWGIPGAPADAFMARGYMGQYTVIVPSADLVIVRFGQSHARAADVASVGRLVQDVIATLPEN